MRLKGHMVEIEFWDHCIDRGSKKQGEPIRIKVWGLVKEVNKKEIVLYQWELQNGPKEVREENAELARILRSTIIGEPKILGYFVDSSKALLH